MPGQRTILPMESLSDFYGAVVDLCDELWRDGHRLPAARLYLALHSGSTSGEVVPQVLECLRTLGSSELPLPDIEDRLRELIHYGEVLVDEPLGVARPRKGGAPSAR